MTASRDFDRKHRITDLHRLVAEVLGIPMSSIVSAPPATPVPALPARRRSNGGRDKARTLKVIGTQPDGSLIVQDAKGAVYKAVLM